MNELFQLKEKVEEKKRLESQLKKTVNDYNQYKRKISPINSANLKKELNDVKQIGRRWNNFAFLQHIGK